MTHIKNEEIIATLVRLADKLDHEGKLDLAEEVDHTLEVFAARPKAPLKSLDEDVKKNLISFLDAAKNNMDSSVKGLDEMFKRLRYFGVDSIIGEMKMDRMLQEMKELQSEVSVATNKFYEMTRGKKPRKGDVESMVASDGQDAQNANDFFASQQAKDSNSFKESDLIERDEHGERHPVVKEDIKCSDCGAEMPIKVCRSGGGFYLGRECGCGPYSRESGYFKTEQEAKSELEKFVGEPETKEVEEDVSLEDFWKDYSSTDKSN